jgi:hypothetical protein
VPVPVLPEGRQEQQLEAIVRNLPNNWFHELAERKGALYPFLWGIAGALAYAQGAYDGAQDAAIPMRSFGAWLSLHLKSIGLDRLPTETDAKAKERYRREFLPTRNTRAAQLDTIAYYTGLEAPQVRLEGDRSSGKAGQFRIVLADQNQPWEDTDLSFVGDLIRRYTANGISPSFNAQLKCLIAGALPAWQFYTQFPTSYTTQGAIWERPAFETPARFDFAQNLFVQATDDEWREQRSRLRKLYSDARAANAPGEFFLYLTDPYSCPYLECDYSLDLITLNPEIVFPDRPALLDGYRFEMDFPKSVPIAADFTAPFLSVPATSLLFLPNIVLPLPSLIASDESLTQAGEGKLLVEYQGVDFSRLEILSFAEPDPLSDDPKYTSAKLTAMRSGNWQLAIGEGDPRWGNFPPRGDTFVSTPIAILDPASIWWTDADGNTRSPFSLFDGNCVYLAIEYCLPAGTERTIREIELKLQGQRVSYRRFNLPIDEDIHAGFIFKVRGTGISVSVLISPEQNFSVDLGRAFLRSTGTTPTQNYSAAIGSGSLTATGTTSSQSFSAAIGGFFLRSLGTTPSQNFSAAIGNFQLLATGTTPSQNFSTGLGSGALTTGSATPSQNFGAAIGNLQLLAAGTTPSQSFSADIGLAITTGTYTGTTPSQSFSADTGFTRLNATGAAPSQSFSVAAGNAQLVLSSATASQNFSTAIGNAQLVTTGASPNQSYSTAIGSTVLNATGTAPAQNFSVAAGNAQLLASSATPSQSFDAAIGSNYVSVSSASPAQSFSAAIGSAQLQASGATPSQNYSAATGSYALGGDGLFFDQSQNSVFIAIV